MTQEKGLQYFPTALFSSVMGVSGVAISLRLVEDLWVNRFIASNVLTGLATFMFIINAVILIYRLAYHLDEVKQDYQHRSEERRVGKECMNERTKHDKKQTS